MGNLILQMKKNQILKRKRENDKTQQKPLTQFTIKHFFKPIQQNLPPETLKKLGLSECICQKVENKEIAMKNEEISQNNLQNSNNIFIEKPKNKENLSPLESTHKRTIKINPDNSFISPKTTSKEIVDYNTSNSKFADNILDEFFRVHENEKKKVLSFQQNLFYINLIG